MKKVISLLIILFLLAGIVSALLNPASVKCEEDGYKLEMRENELGSYGVCIFEDSECEEWAYFREECKPKQCSKISAYVQDGNFKTTCEKYEEQGFTAMLKKYFYIIFSWLWEEDSQKGLQYEKPTPTDGQDLKETEPVEF